MGLTASAVTVITAGEGEAVRGLTATAVSSVSIAPPTLLICVNREGDAHRAISRAGAFCVNVLAEANQPWRIASPAGKASLGPTSSRARTGRVSSPARRRWTGRWSATTGTLAESVEAYTHTVFFGTVRAVRLGPSRRRSSISTVPTARSPEPRRDGIFRRIPNREGNMAISDLALIEAWKDVLTLSKLTAGEQVSLLISDDSNPQLVSTARTAVAARRRAHHPAFAAAERRRGALARQVRLCRPHRAEGQTGRRWRR